jgi:glycosyltransferase 2 family protein
MGLAQSLPAGPDSRTCALPEVLLTADGAAPEPGAVRRSAWSWVFAGALAAVLLYLSLRGVDWRQVWAVMEGARWRYLAIACLVSSVSYFLRAVRWRILLNAEGHLSIGTTFAANMAGYLGNSLLPARAGELIRTFIISSRSSLSKTYVLTTALAERMTDAIALVLWSSVVLLGIHPKPRWLEDASRATTLIAAAGALAIVILPHTGSLCDTIIARIPVSAAMRGRLLRLADQILSGLRAFHDIRRLAGFVLLTVAIWGLDAGGVMIGARALRLNVTFPMAALLICGLGLGSALPSTPGYVGIFQFVAVTVLVPFGIPRDSALAFILVAQALGYVVVLVLGLPGVMQYRGWRSTVRSTPASG